MTKAYGIDFGTTNSTVAIVEGKTVKKISVDPNAENPSIMRSTVYVNDKHEFLYGKSAIDAYGRDVVTGKGRVKKAVFTGRYITVAGKADIHGVLPDEIVEELIEFDEFQGGRMIQSLKSILANSKVSGISLFGKVYPIEEVIGGFLKEMKKRADGVVGENVDSVVIGRPVKYVGGEHKLAILRMEKALKLAGFKHLVFEYEPIAAAWDYEQSVKTPQTVLTFDFGGGTLDVSIVEFPSKKVLANNGLPIGGDYFNSQIFLEKIAEFFGSKTTYGPNKMFMPSYIYLALRNWYTATLLKDENFDEQMNHFRFMSSSPEKIDALRSLINNNLSFSLYDEIDRVKRKLSEKSSDTFRFVEDHINIETAIQKPEFEEWIKEYLDEIDKLLDNTLSDAGLSSEKIDAVATTGGSSLIPVVRNLLESRFDKEKIIESDAFTSVAAGLALEAQLAFN